MLVQYFTEGAGNRSTFLPDVPKVPGFKYDCLDEAARAVHAGTRESEISRLGDNNPKVTIPHLMCSRLAQIGLSETWSGKTLAVVRYDIGTPLNKQEWRWQGNSVEILWRDYTEYPIGCAS